MNQTMQKADLSCPLPAARSRRPEVNVIPATKRSVESGGQIKKQRSLRVAAYCRVSTGDESQQTSYTTQRKFYTELITSKPGWDAGRNLCRRSDLRHLQGEKKAV